MGSNTSDRNHRYELRQLARRADALACRGLALRLIVTGSRDFGDRWMVFRVLDRLHCERGIATLLHAANSRADYIAGKWALSRRRAVLYVPPALILREPVHGVLAFEGPDRFIDRARQAGLVVWRVARRATWPGCGAPAVEIPKATPPGVPVVQSPGSDPNDAPACARAEHSCDSASPGGPPRPAGLTARS